MIDALFFSASAFTAPLTLTVGRARTKALRLTTLSAAAEAEADDDKPQVHLESIGSIVEFDDGKHDRSMLGIVQTADAKAKGGSVYTVIDAHSNTHSVKGKSIHCAFPGDTKSKKAEPAAVLAPFEEVHELDSTHLGVEPELLELAWEVLDDDKDSWSAKSILQAIDDKLCKSNVESYKAFRLLTSDLGRVFFKSLSNNRFKAKNAKSVQASKQNWCREHEELDYCFV